MTLSVIRAQLIILLELGYIHTRIHTRAHTCTRTRTRRVAHCHMGTGGRDNRTVRWLSHQIDTQQAEISAGAKLGFSFLFSPGSRSMGWHCPRLGYVCLSQVIFSRNSPRSCGQRPGFQMILHTFKLTVKIRLTAKTND